ncbi:zinc ABC transporter substrate-binding protein [Bradymonadaceae bacterium TMQ3]|uniref:Zinc ABC transporter substrate-binding protein n=2 Tax=Lujinxingia sediminis TaxID=2480984 RepID=A0ABY0CPP9_9DELT|nr:zinc ABC transporter substrate-binding protein [Bradymonadaceae bacterium TMQ3]RVU42132.1 zinc ABC transporter substrate-binding protein [Lujinxingia sediminis]TXC69511.1 zinc ABC transporter substrate-binding protein [Bradymonadales bacterium TMQ1]
MPLHRDGAPMSHPLKRRKPAIITALFGLIATLLIMAASPASAELRVVATTPDLGAIATEVLGDQGTVEVLVRPGDDPHFVDPRPSFVPLLHRADLLVLVGMDLEVGWLPTLITGARNPKIQAGQPGYFDASAHIVAADVPRGPVDRTMGDVHPGGNPHYTTDPRQGARVALALGRHLAELDPPHAEAYVKRSRDLARDLIRLAQRFELQFRELPAERRQVVTYHKSWTYVAGWLSLTDVMQIEPKPGVPPNPRHVARLVETIQERNVPAILQLNYYPTRTAEQLSERTDATLLRLPAQTSEGQRYVEHLEALAERIYETLKPALAP